MKKILSFCLFCLIIQKSLYSQHQSVLEFHPLDSIHIDYDFSKYSINVKGFGTPDTHYVSQILFNKGYSVYSRHDCKNQYVFPLNISCKDSIYLMTFTYGGLYELYEEDFVKQPVNDMQLVNYIMSLDTLVIDSLPTSIIGSANYQTLFTIDPEFILFSTNKWLFLNFFFRINESGLQYEYIGHDIQIPAVVLQLFSWGILVSDGCGGDNHSTIYIEFYNYPNNLYSEKPSDYSWVDNWMRLFGNKHIIGKYLLERTEWEMWDTEWWEKP